MGASLSRDVAVVDAVRRRDTHRLRQVLKRGEFLPIRISRLLTSADLENLPGNPPGIPPPPELPIGSSLLHEAAANHAPTLQALLEHQPPLHKRDFSGLTPLGRAVSAGNLDAIRLLCKAGARPFEKRIVLSESSTLPKELNDSRSHVRYAAVIGSPQILSILIEIAGTDDFDSDGARSIHDAIAAGHVECVKVLLSKDLEDTLDEVPEGTSNEEWDRIWNRQRSLRALKLFTIKQTYEEAAAEGETNENDEEQNIDDISDNDTANDDDMEDSEDVEESNETTTVQVHIQGQGQEGANAGTLTTQLDQLVTALRQAMTSFTSTTVRAHRGLSLLHYACVKSQPQVLEYLLSTKEFRAAINDPNESCKTAIFLAVRSESHECFDLLVSAGANLVVGDMENWTLLHEAVKLGDSGEYFTRQLAEVHKVDVNAVDDDGWSPLHVAARFSSPAAVDILVENGAQIDALTDDKETPLLFASSQEKSAEVLKKLLGHGADLLIYEHTPLSPLRLILSRNDNVQLGYLLDHITTLDTDKRRRSLSLNISSESDDPLLHFLSRQSDARVVSKLAPLVPNIDATNTEGATALHIASFNGKTKIVEALVRHGAQVDSIRPDGTTAMHLACDRGHPAIVRNLLAGGSDPDFAVPGQSNRYYGFTPLMFASRQGSQGATIALLEAGANVNQAKDDGFTALHLAALNRHPKICRMLLNAGALPNKLNSQGVGALHIAVKSHSVPLVTELVVGGADPNVPTSRGLVPLHLATSQGDTHVVWVLIRAGGNVNYRTGRLETPVHIAANGERTQASLQLLLANGGRHDLRDVDGDTPLHVACIPGRNAQARMLLHRGADPSAVNSIGATPLHYTATYGNDRMAELLLSFGANANLKDHRGETPYSLASRRQGAREMMVTIFRRMNLTLDEIAPRTPYETDPSASSGDPLCVICQHRFREGDLTRQLQCGHRYHDECIESWLGGDDLSKNDSCPLCQACVLPSTPTETSSASYNNN